MPTQGIHRLNPITMKLRSDMWQTCWSDLETTTCTVILKTPQ